MKHFINQLTMVVKNQFISIWQRSALPNTRTALAILWKKRVGNPWIAALLSCAMTLVLPSTVQAQQPTAPPIWGFADTHVHQFNNLGFGGLMFQGAPFDPGGIALALPHCDGSPGQLFDAFFNPPPLFLPLPTPIIPVGFCNLDPTIPGCPAYCPPCPVFVPGTSTCAVPCFALLAHGPLGVNDIIGAALDQGAYHPVGGYPEFDGWPRWDSKTHQQVYYEWLERAFRGGLKLMVMLAGNNEVLGEVSNHKTAFGCNDMDAVDRQVAKARDLQTFIDDQNGGPGKGWYRIAYSGREARQIINSGKMAVVLGAEVPTLFNCRKNDASCDEDHVRKELQKYYAMGLRHLFPIHNADNRFGGTAIYTDIFDLSNKKITGDWWDVGGCDTGRDGAKLIDYHLRVFDTLNDVADAATVALILNPVTGVAGPISLNAATLFRGLIVPGVLPPKPPSGPNCNKRGLEDIGEFLVREMMDKKMIIDVDHMSARALNRTLEIAEERHYPGIVMGHTGFIENNKEQEEQVNKRSEANKTADQVERLRALGGLIGIILHQGKTDEINAFEDSPSGFTPTLVKSRVKNDCGESSKTWAQAYLYAVEKMKGGAVAFGSDFNGLAGQPAPRFDGVNSKACNGDKLDDQGAEFTYPFTIHGQLGKLDKSMVGQKIYDFNHDGLAHIGMYPDFINELKSIGVSDDDLKPLFNSAEAYVKMWERAENTNPLAKSKNVTVSADANCSAQVSIDDGSSDPDGDPITLSQSPAGPYSRGTTLVTLTVMDSFGASNTSQATVTVVDDKLPTITCPLNQVVSATSSAGAAVNYPAPTVADNCPGAKAVCSLPTGSTFSIGINTVTCTVTDASGNQATCNFTVKVKGAAEQINDLISLLRSYQLESGIENSLLVKLQPALAALQAGDIATACIRLTAFINEVKAQSGKKFITAAQANQMVAAAQQIKDVLGCP
jgi:microsomal dipeptidase-like Zn-dependent dipeptidase